MRGRSSAANGTFYKGTQMMIQVSPVLCQLYEAAGPIYAMQGFFCCFILLLLAPPHSASLVSWCLEPSQPQGSATGLFANTEQKVAGLWCSRHFCYICLPCAMTSQTQAVTHKSWPCFFNIQTPVCNQVHRNPSEKLRSISLFFSIPIMGLWCFQFHLGSPLKVIWSTFLHNATTQKIYK